MEIAADVAELDQLRQLAFARRLQLAAPLAQLRLDVLVAEALVDLGLGRAVGDVTALGFGDAVCVQAVRWVLRNLIGDASSEKEGLIREHKPEELYAY